MPISYSYTNGVKRASHLKASYTKVRVRKSFLLRGDASKVSCLCSLYFLLEAGLLCEYIFDCLFLTDIIHLDSAMSCANTRPSFLIVLRLYMKKVFTHNSVIKGNQIKWLVARDITIEKCKLEDIRGKKFTKFINSQKIIQSIIYLDLSKVDVYITNEHFIILFKNCPNLLELYLSSNCQITNRTLIYISTYCPKLCIIDFGTQPLTSYRTIHGLKTYINRCRNLKNIKFTFSQLEINQLNDIVYTGEICGKYINTIDINLEGSYQHHLFTFILNRITNMLIQNYINLICISLIGVYDINIDEVEEEEQSVEAGQAINTLLIAYAGLEQLTLTSLYISIHTANIITSMTRLTKLELLWCYYYDESIILLSTALPHLTHVDLVGSSCITDAAIMALAQNCIKLESVDISEQALLTDASLYALAKHCPQLQVLHMRELVLVTDPGLRAVVTGCPLLRELDLSSCSKLGACIYDICDSCPKLQDLIIPVHDYDIITYLLQHGGRLHRVSWKNTDYEKVRIPKATPDIRILLLQYNWEPRASEVAYNYIGYDRKYGYTISSSA